VRHGRVVFELEAERSTRNRLGKRVTNPGTVTRDDPLSRRLSEPRTRSEVLAVGRTSSVPHRQSIAATPLFALGAAFSRAKSRVRRGWPRKRERLKALLLRTRGRRLSEIRMPLPEVKPDKGPTRIAGSPFMPVAPFFGPGWRF
jgi:hypothetical protein